MAATVQQIVEATFKEERGRALAAVISQIGDFEVAEEALQDALIAALEQWQQEGVPRNPGAWLTAIAKRRAIDRLRRRSARERKQVALHDVASMVADPPPDEPGDEAKMDDNIPDERLKLMFTCCHPALAREAQVALTLHTLGGLTTTEVARAFLVPPTTMAQRLTRAKAKIRNAGIPFQIPPLHLLPERMEALLAVLYLIFNEGYAASSGDTLIRRELCQEAIRLAHVLTDLLPDDNAALKAESLGLLALMLLHDSRRDARLDSEGNLVLLEDQDRSLWDHAQIGVGVEILERALKLNQPGPYQVQAAISAVHADAPSFADTDWRQIAALYRVLWEMNPSPVVAINRAVATAMIEGAQVGLRWLLLFSEDLKDYMPFHAARADLLRRSNQREAAADAYQRALALCDSAPERAYLMKRLKEMGGIG